MVEDAKKILKLMGCPVIASPGEAEAQCAYMVANDLAYGTASEDMDTLTFGSNYLLRGFKATKEPVTQIELAEVLNGFGMTMDEFIDLCILCGCDYTNTVSGIGPTTAFKLIKDCGGTLENVLKRIERDNKDPKKRKKVGIPEEFLYEESRVLFKEPNIIRDLEEIKSNLVWNKADEEGLREFLIVNKKF